MNDKNFNFDLKNMKKAIESPRTSVPKFNNYEEFEDWLDNMDISINNKLKDYNTTIENQDSPEFDNDDERDAWFDEQ